MMKVLQLGENDGTCEPGNPSSPTNALALVGDPGVDNATLATAGFYGGKIMTISGTGADGHPLVVPCDASNGNVPYGLLINGPGENSGAIGPSGSRKTPVVRAMPSVFVDTQAYDSAKTYNVGAQVFCGGSEATSSGAGLFVPAVAVANPTKTAYVGPVGVVTHKPTATEAWLGVALTL